MNFEDHFMPSMDEEAEFLPIITDEELESDEKIEVKGAIPILTLRNSVIFPGVVMPITLGRDASIKAVKYASKKKKLIAVLAQTNPEIEEPTFDDIYDTGTLARIIKVIKMPDGMTTVILQGAKKIKLVERVEEEPFFKGHFDSFVDTKPKMTKEFKALVSSLKDKAKEVIKKSNNIPSEAAIILKNIKSQFFLINFIGTNLNVGVAEKQALLEITDFEKRASKILEHLQQEVQMLDLKNQIQNKTRHELEKQQRDYFLHQQMKNIQEELGQETPAKEAEGFREKAKGKKWSKEASEVFEKELKKLQRTNPAAPEYGIILNHIELMLDLPWEETTKDNLDLKKSKKVLDAEHYGLDKIKKRILEYLAVLKLKGDMKSPILCFVGPPGVGKTSLGKSIAAALNRKYVRMSLGGLHDESEIRGHRKTYIGAMPGRIIQSLKKVKSSNPVFILDEIDKVGKGFRGDPSSALLEVLDPEQNTTFYDNFLEVEYDLSKVMFVATANQLNTIQPALRDRMEIIQLAGYSVEEKIEIAKKHLIPGQRKAHGLKATQVKFTKKTLEAIVEKYTRESGVRSLEQKIASVMRSVAMKVAMDEEYNVSVTVEDVEEYLGKGYSREKHLEGNPAGVAIGLAYTTVGGDILFIEANKSKGKSNLILTGSLGDVMKESATTALSYIKSKAKELGINEKVFEENTFHVHVPEGATPKDGPSAGITILTTLCSLILDKKVKPYLAMSGEITLRGKVLPVGGIKEKVLAAKRSGIKEIILCKMNEKDVEEINQDFIKGVKFHFVTEMQEVLEIALK
ncbi:MAG: endopeptidase La [Chitinophagales bacterium]